MHPTPSEEAALAAPAVTPPEPGEWDQALHEYHFDAMVKEALKSKRFIDPVTGVMAQGEHEMSVLPRQEFRQRVLAYIRRGFGGVPLTSNYVAARVPEFGIDVHVSVVIGADGKPDPEATFQSFADRAVLQVYGPEPIETIESIIRPSAIAFLIVLGIFTALVLLNAYVSGLP